MINMRIGIVGCGFVGNAIWVAMKKRDLPVVVYDKYKDLDPVESIVNTDLVFLCLPTPIDPTTSTYDLSALKETCQFLHDHRYQGIVLIKSTVLPTTSEELAQDYSLPIIHNPEFLTARTAVEDFENQQHVVLGTTKQATQSQIDLIIDFYQTQFPTLQKISLLGSNESEAVKLFCNSFYAVKVQIFNEFYLLCQHLGLDYDRVRDTMLDNGWINPMHTQIPGPDGQLSYGGLCFVKDTKALLAQLIDHGCFHGVLSATVTERDLMRGLSQ